MDARQYAEHLWNGGAATWPVEPTEMAKVLDKFAATRERAAVERVLEIVKARHSDAVGAMNNTAKEKHRASWQRAAIEIAILREAIRAAFPAQAHGAADGGGEGRRG